MTVAEDDGIVVDVAGAKMGGAGRWLAELDAHGAATGARFRVTGRGRPVSLGSLIARETTVARARSRRVVATNNVSFLAPLVAERVVLVRNALHFLDPREATELAGMASRPWERQARVVRGLLRRATLVVVPSTSMADRVRAHVPSVAERIVVRFHPVSPQRRTDRPTHERMFRFLCPVLDAPFKRLDLALQPVLEALDMLAARPGNAPFCLDLTMGPSEACRLAHNRPWVTPLGRLTVGDLDLRRRSADALVYPTTLESFGYPLAEARAEGRWVLAPTTDHNQEIAGRALVPYGDGAEHLSATIEQMLAGSLAPPEPDPGPFSSERYFGWLLGDPRPV